MPQLTGHPRLVIADQEIKQETEAALKEKGQLPTATNSYAAISASGKLPPIPQELKRKVSSPEDTKRKRLL